MSSLTVTGKPYNLYSYFESEQMLSSLNIQTKVQSHSSSQYLNQVKFLRYLHSALDEIEIDDSIESMNETIISTNLNQY